MSEHYDFHYQPTGSGAISGQQVLEQTEDAINELGDYVNDNVGGAMDVAQQALETAQNAETNAQTALDTANSFSSAIQSAQQDASTALSTAQTAQTTASNANNTAIQASQDASSAVTTANNASGQVTTLSGTVTALGQRVTTAEGNIGQNTSDITALTTRVGTAEGNITTLQNDVSVAMGNASSAMATAGTVKQQAYVFRYSSTALVASSTNSNTLLDNTDNLKVGDKVIDSSGVLFSITAIDTVNSTFTIGSALVDLALDANVVHTSGNETVDGNKTFTGEITNNISNKASASITLKNSSYDPKINGQSNANASSFSITFSTLTDDPFAYISAYGLPEYSLLRLTTTYFTDSENSITDSIEYRIYPNGDRSFRPRNQNNCMLGETGRRWKSVYATNYYYGSDNTEFSTKFVTTDTNQTITEIKTFTKNVTIKNENVTIGSTSGAGSKDLTFTDSADNTLAKITGNKASNGSSGINFRVDTTDNNNANINSQFSFFIAKSGTKVVNPIPDNDISLGRTSNRWKDTCTCLINGLTPSSLSMPSDRSARVDISGYFTNTANNGINTYTVPANGWIYLNLNDVVTVHCLAQAANTLTHYGQTFARASAGKLYCLFPVRKDDVLSSQWYTTTTVTVTEAYFIPCQGNV